MRVVYPKNVSNQKSLGQSTRNQESLSSPLQIQKHIGSVSNILGTSIAGYGAYRCREKLLKNHLYTELLPVLREQREINMGIFHKGFTDGLVSIMEQSGLNAKGVRLINHNINDLSNRHGVDSLPRFIENIQWPEKLQKFNLTERIRNIVYRDNISTLNEIARPGSPLGLFNEKTNSVFANLDDNPIVAFHEIGHALDYNSSALKRFFLKYSCKMSSYLPPAIIATSLLALPKVLKNCKTDKERVKKENLAICGTVGAVALSQTPSLLLEKSATKNAMQLIKDYTNLKNNGFSECTISLDNLDDPIKNVEYSAVKIIKDRYDAMFSTYKRNAIIWCATACIAILAKILWDSSLSKKYKSKDEEPNKIDSMQTMKQNSIFAEFDKKLKR